MAAVSVHGCNVHVRDVGLDPTILFKTRKGIKLDLKQELNKLHLKS
jgi:IS5 family transposase